MSSVAAVSRTSPLFRFAQRHPAPPAPEHQHPYEGLAKRLAKVRDTIMGRVSAFVPEHCGTRARASIRSDADFGSGLGSADRRSAAARPSAVALPWVRQRTAMRQVARPAPSPRKRDRRLGQDRHVGMKPDPIQPKNRRPARSARGCSHDDRDHHALQRDRPRQRPDVLRVELADVLRRVDQIDQSDSGRGRIMVFGDSCVLDSDRSASSPVLIPGFCTVLRRPDRGWTPRRPT